MTGEPPNGARVTPRELETLRKDHGRRIGNLEATVSDHEALIQQLRGAKALLVLVFGTSLATLVLAVLAIVR